LPQNKKIVLYIAEGGKKNPFKGSEYVEQVVQRYKTRTDILFVSVGGSHKDRYQKENILYIPKLHSKEDLAKIYSSADVLLNPTLAESFGLVVVEAMACGTPVVAFKTGGVPEIIDHEPSGYLARYKDTDQLCKYIEKILSHDASALAQMSHNAIQKASQFTQQKMCQEYLKLYKSLL
jgi:glycosyltransferase involved in cell wall biosynthesis